MAALTRSLVVLLGASLASACAPAREPMRLVSPSAPIAETTVTGPRAEGAALDVSCRVDADCTVKDVGNCCGYYPACVNVDSPTDPEGVRERCEREGLSSICGFPDIDACRCDAGTCRSVGAAESR